MKVWNMRSFFIVVCAFRDVARIEITLSIPLSLSLPQRQCFVLIVSSPLFTHNWKKTKVNFPSNTVKAPPPENFRPALNEKFSFSQVLGFPQHCFPFLAVHNSGICGRPIVDQLVVAEIEQHQTAKCSKPALRRKMVERIWFQAECRLDIWTHKYSYTCIIYLNLAMSSSSFFN